jgi:hypothetical protein
MRQKLSVQKPAARGRRASPSYGPSCCPGLCWAAGCAYAVRRCGCRKAASDGCSEAEPDLLTARMLKLVLDDAPGSLPGSTGGEILCAVAQVFANGDIPAFIMPHFSSATVLATPKLAGGVRPLAIGMRLRRLISSVVLRRVISKAREYLAPHQVEVGVKLGCDLVVHKVRSAIDEHGAEDA